MIYTQLFIKSLELIGFFVDRWAKNQRTKDEWKALVASARQKYNREGATESAEIKKDYDALQEELRAGRWKK